ncbi:MAG: twin-arginine translocation signal domain-containing protein [Chloroflexi bacterium]|nr:twin-arginine translocation signal domain-containing protein [Chloroflexota bacterium]
MADISKNPSFRATVASVASTTRRDFLKKGAAAGAAAAVMYVAPSMSSTSARPAYASITGGCPPLRPFTWTVGAAPPLDLGWMSSLIYTVPSSGRTFIYVVPTNSGGDRLMRAEIVCGEVTNWTMVSMALCSSMNSTNYGVASAIDQATGTIYIGTGIVGFDSGQRTICSGRIGSDGWVVSNQWQDESGIGTGRFDANMIVHRNTLYVVGGTSSNNGFQSSVEYASIGGGGTLSTWSYTSSMLNARPTTALAVIPDGADYYLYAIGGGRHGTLYNTVERARILAGGALGVWSSAGSLSSSPRRGIGVTVNDDGYVYAMGGHPGAFGAGSPTNYVERAQLTGSGLGAWAAWDPMLNGRDAPAVSSKDGNIYTVNGRSPASMEYARP